MKKIVSNILVVGSQLMVGVLFLCMLFSDSNEDLKVVVVDNDNLNKMADSVSELFKEEDILINTYDDFREFELFGLGYEEKKEVDSAKEVEVIEEVEEPQEIIVVDPSGYTNMVERGFVVTTDNKTYNLSDEELYIVSSVVTCEANKSSRDDILGVMSVILNRADANGISPAAVVAAKGQFECYKMLFIEGTHSVVSTSLVNQVISDALNGIRNNEYMGFNSWYSYQYSDNYIVERGNRYR